MKVSFKKLTAWLCCMAMIISFIPATALPVFADEATEPVALTLTEGELAAGEYVLTQDLALTGTLTVKKNVDVTIDLAGYDISGSVFPLINTAGNLTIKDSTATGTPGVDYEAGAIKATAENTDDSVYGMVFPNDGTFTLESGKLTGYAYNGTKARGGAVALLNNAVFNMNGGEISGNTGNQGGGVHVNNTATFNMTGGAIVNNTATTYGGGIFAAHTGTTINIEDGVISGTAPKGGAISTAESWANTKRAVLNISGGEISGTATTAATSAIAAYAADFTMTGGTVTGQIWGRHAGMEISGGTIDGTLNVRPDVAGASELCYLEITGNPVIKGSAISLTVTHASGDRLMHHATIGELTEGASVRDNFKALEVLDATCKQEGDTYTWQAITLPQKGNLLVSEEYVLEDDLELTGTLTVKSGAEIVIDLAGNTISMVDGTSTTFFAIEADAKLTIKDSIGGGKVQFKEMTASGGISNYGTFVLEGGELNGWSRVEGGALKTGGFIDMWSGATFEMTGGKITGVSAATMAVLRSQTAGGITVEITGGEISGNNSNGNLISVTGTADNLSTLIIGGDAVVDGNTKNGAEFDKEEICGTYTNMIISDTATVGALYLGSSAVEGVTDYGSISVTGAPTVDYISVSTTGRTPVTIKELTNGAAIKTPIALSLKEGAIDESVVRTGPDAENRNVYTYAYKVPTYAVTVNQATGGTIEVDVTEGIEGATVTVTATPDEGFELEAILVNGEAIDGNTFAIVAGENNVTATFVAVAVGLPTEKSVASGEYVLAADHVLTNQLTFVNGVDVVIDLAGHTITMPDVDGYYFHIDATSKLTIKDSAGGGKVQFKNTKAGNAGINVYGTFVLEGGELTGWSRVNDGVYGAGGLMNMWPNSTFIMTGGSITDCECAGDVVIRNQGTTDGGRTVTITGGTITGNNANSGNVLSVVGVDANPSTLTIGGNAVITGNTKAGVAMSTEEVYGAFTHVTIGGNATVGSAYTRASDAVEGVEGFPYGSLTITGAAKVGNITMNSSARTPLVIKELTEGAEIKTAMALGASQKDATVARTETQGEDGLYTYTWQDPATIVYNVTVTAPENGAVTVEPASGVIGTTVTVTATAAEGYKLETILVNGKAIEGNTFAIAAGANEVTATFVEDIPEGFPTSGNIAAGEYVLTEDVQLTGALAIAKDTDVVIDLAGYSIYAVEGKNDVFTVYGNLTVKDGVGGGKIVADGEPGANQATPTVSIQSGSFTLEGGEITGWERSVAGENGALTYAAGGMVFLAADTTFNMKGGKLTGAKAGYGAAIRVNAAGAVVNMTGGEISGNMNTGEGSIWLVAGTEFNMTGGTITNNTAASGAAICMYGAAEVTISGGEITNNTATADAGAILNKGTVTITGGTFTGNTAGNQGGVILVQKNSTTTITGGTFTGNSAKRGGAIGSGEVVLTANLPALTIGGTAVIEANECTEYGGNIYLYTTTLNIEGGKLGTALKAGADGGKGSGNIWLRGNDATVNTITGGNVYAIQATNGTTNVSGNPVIAELNATATISNLTSGANIHTAGTPVTVPEGDETVYTADGRNYFFKGDLGFADKFVAGETVTLTEDTSVGAGVELTTAGEYVLDLAGFELTGNAAPYFTIAAGAKLTIVDSSEGKTGKIVGLAEATNPMIQVKGEFVLAGGTLTGHHSNAVKLDANATMTMTGGEISGNYANRGAGVTSGDVTNSGVTFTMTGGIIKDNVCTGTGYRGANFYFFDPAMVTIAENATIGGAYIQDAEGNLTLAVGPVYFAEVRGGNTTITGGTIKQMSLSKSSVNATATISGNPKIELLNANLSNSTIGNLTSGARITVDTNNALTVAEGDKTVNAQTRLYRYAGDIKSILFVANSFGGDTVNYMTKLGNYFGIEVDPAYLYVGSQNIRWHAQSLAESLRNTDLNGDGVIGDSRDRVEDGLYTCAGFEGYVDIPTVLEGKKWDYVVLQQGVEFVGFEGTYNSDVDFLLDYIADVQPDAKVLFSQTWAVDNRSWSTQVNPDAPESVEQGGQWVNSSSYLTQFGGSQEAMYDAILRNTDLFFAGDDARFDVDGYLPIGIAIQTMRQNYTDSYLTRDGFHLSKNAGRMIAGLTALKTLFPDIDLSTLTAADMAAMFDADSATNVHLNDAFEATEANVATLLAAVETACGYAAADTVPAYGDGTANKQFNPDAAGAYVAVYEGITEVGQAATNERYATTGAGKIVIYKDGVKTAAIDELWLEANAGIVLTNRYENLDGTYYIQADPQNPQLAIIGSTLYLTFDVKLYGDAQNTITNGGIYLTTSTDGKTWTPAVKVSEAPMAYGLTALSDGNLIMSIADTATKAVKISTAGAVISSVELEAAVADVAFAEVGSNVFALSSTGALYVSADKGATWTATGVANGASASPDLVSLGDNLTVYATWSDEANLDIYSKVWTIDAADTTAYGWNDNDAAVIAEYAPATAYNGKTTGGQPSTVLVNSSAVRGIVKTYYVSGGELQTNDYTVSVRVGRNLSLESSLSINFMVPKTEVDAMGGAYAKVVRSNAAAGVEGVETIIDLADCTTSTIQGALYYVVSYSGVQAKQMGDSVWFAVYNEAGQQVTKLDRYSILAYAENQFTKSKDTVLHTMLVDMLNYGAAAQISFNYATNALVNANLTDAQKALASAELVLDDTLTENGFVNTDGVRCGKNLSLESVIEMNLQYVLADAPDAAYAQVSYTNHAGRVIDKVRYELTDSKVSGLAAKKVKIDTLETADVFTQVTIELCDANGNVISGTYCVYSIATYAYNTISKDATADAAVLAMRLMQFGSSAYNFLNK